jgi:hypothetical protein
MFVLFCLLVALSAHPACSADTTETGAASEDEANDKSLTEVNKELTNPVGSSWSLTFKQNNYLLDNPDRWRSNLQFQPVLPVSLTNDWNLITRPTIPFFLCEPHQVTAGATPRVNIETTTGFGDMMLVEMLSPAPLIAGHWLLGAGPTRTIRIFNPSLSTSWAKA